MIISFKKLWVLFNKRERLQIVGLLIAVICMALAQVIGVASIMPFMNLVMDPGMIEENFVFNYLYNFFQFESSSIFTVFAGLTMVFIIVMSNAISTFAIWYKLKFIWKNNHRLSVKLLKQYMAKPYSYFLIHNSADLGKNVLQEVQTLTRGYLLQLMDFITYGLVTVAIMTFLFVINIKVTLAAIFILGGSYGLIYLITNRKMERAGQKRMEANKYRYKSAAEAFNGIKQLKISSREEKFLSRFTGCSKRYANLCAFHDMVVLLPRYMLEAVAFGGVVLLVLYLIVTGEDVKGVVPVVSLFAFAGYRLMPALQKVFAAANSLVFNSAILDRVYEDIFARGEFASILWPVDTPEPLRFCDRIELKGITYTYPDDNSPVLRNIDLCVKHDTAIGLVGATGCGKSTLVNIILGLLRPETGEIVVDGQELNDDRLRNWQLNIGYVAQQIYLSDDTILNNIAFGIPEEEIDFSAVKKAARIASIDQFIENELSDGYKTIVGERGIRVSGGQRQRIGLARALYHDPEVLILDEATSSLDGATQKSVMTAIENIAEVKTIVMIAHRLSTVKNCDNIYLIEQGNIVDSGSYDTLVNSSDKFRKLAELNG